MERTPHGGRRWAVEPWPASVLNPRWSAWDLDAEPPLHAAPCTHPTTVPVVPCGLIVSLGAMWYRALALSPGRARRSLGLPQVCHGVAMWVPQRFTTTTPAHVTRSWVPGGQRRCKLGLLCHVLLLAQGYLLLLHLLLCAYLLFKFLPVLPLLLFLLLSRVQVRPRAGPRT